MSSTKTAMLLFSELWRAKEITNKKALRKSTQLIADKNRCGPKANSLPGFRSTKRQSDTGMLMEISCPSGTLACGPSEGWFFQECGLKSHLQLLLISLIGWNPSNPFRIFSKTRLQAVVKTHLSGVIWKECVEIPLHASRFIISPPPLPPPQMLLAQQLDLRKDLSKRTYRSIMSDSKCNSALPEDACFVW